MYNQIAFPVTLRTLIQKALADYDECFTKDRLKQFKLVTIYRKLDFL